LVQSGDFSSNSSEMNDLHDQVCVITGATSGVGRVLALALARRGGRLFLLGRNRSRANRLLQTIRNEVGTGRAEFLPCELSDLTQVRRTAATIRAATPCVHLLVNNAHVRCPSFQSNPDGVEMTFAVNHLAYFALTALLLESLLAAPEARILNVAGDAYLWGCSAWERCTEPAAFERGQALATSKLANVVFTIELARRLRGTSVSVNAAHPGIMATRAGTNGRLWMLLKYYLYYGFKGELISPRRAALPLVDLCTAPQWRGVSGCYFSGGRPQEVTAEARDPEVASRLWRLSLQWTRLGPDLGPAWKYFGS
jgi:NAD(P)-dependent dehydrogenase (short-subunit alcohol dehydrogenase family)